MLAMQGGISVINLDGSNYTVITTDVFEPTSIDYDPVHSYVYYVDRGNINRYD